MADGKVTISTALDNSGIKKDAAEVTPIVKSEFQKAGAEAAQAFSKACSGTKAAMPVIDLDTGQVTQAAQNVVIAADQTAQAGQNVATTVQETAAAAAQTSASLSGTAQSVGKVTSAVSAQDQKIQEILADTERSAKSKAASIAAVYRQQGLDQQEAMKKAWEQIERTSQKSSENVGKNIRESIGDAVREVVGEFGGLNSVVKRLAATLAAVFSLQQIASFATESSQAAMSLSDALTGLQSILEGQGRSFLDAQSFIEEYTKDGLIPATNAITAYKNLASRGYDDSQIQQVMTALKDASAYGRQASYTMGEAVQSATEGLKNENSILVDNAGVTKNVAKMWEEYAASIGTTANNLTQQQKIQAEVTGILEESKYQAGDAAKVAGTLSGQLQQLSFNFNNLKVAVGNFVNPILQTFLPAVNSAITALTKFANTVASVVGAIFGKATVQTSALADSNNSVASSASAGAAAEEELADATAAAGKAAKKSLASFDELNVLQSGTDGGSGSSAGSSSGSSSGTSSTTATTEVEDTISPKLQAMVDKVKELIAPLQQIDFTPVVEAFGRLKEAIEPITAKLFEGLEWAWYNILVPLAGWTIEDVLPAFLDLLSAALELLNSVIEALQPGAEWLWNNFLQPLASWTGGVIVDALKEVTDLFRDLSDVISGDLNFGEFLGQLTPVQTTLLGIAAAFTAIKIASAGMTIFTTVTTFLTNITGATGVIGKFAQVFMLASGGAHTLSSAMSMVFGPGSIIAGIGAIVGGAVLAVTNFFSMLEGGFSWIKEALMLVGIAIAAVGAIILGAPALVVGIIAAIVAAVATVVVVVKEHWNEICAWFSELCTNIGEFFSGLWADIQSIWEAVSSWFDTNVIQPVSTFFSDLWESISQWASDTWESIKDFFAPAIEWFSELLSSVGQTFEDIFYNIGVIVSGCWEIIKAVWDIVATWFDENVIQPVAGFFEDLWASVSTWVSDAWGDIKETLGAVASWIDTNLIQPVSTFFSDLWDGFSTAASDAWDAVCGVFSDVAGFFEEVFSDAWQGIVDVFSVAGEIFTDIKDGILEAFKSIVNGIITGLNSAISIPFDGINTALEKIRDIQILGITPFSGLKTISVPQIPYLAQGAVLPANKPFLAMVGDQKNGTNIEAPLETIKQALEEVMASRGTGDINITFTGDLAQLGRVLKPVVDAENRRVGGSLVKGAY